MEDLQSLLPTQYLELVPMVIAVVAMLRDRLPKVDGQEIVNLVAVAISIGLCFLVGGDTPAHLVKFGIMVALFASGGMQALKYHATKSGETTAARLSIPPPSKVPSIGPQRGFTRTGPALLLVVVSVALLVFSFLYACAAKPLVCPIVKVLDEACPYVMVELGDGTREQVPREQIAGLALRARAARGVPDAGPVR